jgi:hypothetical protein
MSIRARSLYFINYKRTNLDRAVHGLPLCFLRLCLTRCQQLRRVLVIDLLQDIISEP